MTRAPIYPLANTSAQRFDDNYSSVKFTRINKGVLHTEEVPGGWPSYSSGASAPNMSGNPNIRKKRIDWRVHFPAGYSARALVNAPGGVSTNTEADGVFQIELSGTCAKSMVNLWARQGKKAGRDYIYWPDAPDWALRDLANLLAWLHIEWGMPLVAPAVWPSYEDAASGRVRARMSFHAWDLFAGVCGHTHVAENQHLDPGHIDIAKVLKYAREAVAKATGGPAPTATPVRTGARVVTVRKGQTLAGIAAAAGLTLAAVLGANHFKDPDTIQPGTHVTLPAKPPVTTKPAPTVKPAPSVKPAPKPTVKPTGRRPVLKVGSRGEPVKAVQRFLRIAADGSYGPKTAAAVKAFQVKAHLKPTGVVDSATWRKIPA